MRPGTQRKLRQRGFGVLTRLTTSKAALPTSQTRRLSQRRPGALRKTACRSRPGQRRRRVGAEGRRPPCPMHRRANGSRWRTHDRPSCPLCKSASRSVGIIPQRAVNEPEARCHHNAKDEIGQNIRQIREHQWRPPLPGAMFPHG